MLYGYLFQLVCTVLPALALSACVNEAPPSQTAIEWNEVAWEGGSLNVALVRPTDEGSGPHPVIVALPWGSGSAELVESFIYSYWLTEPSARGITWPHSRVRGSTLVDTADEIVPALFAWMRSEFDFDASKVALVGASNGGRGVFFTALAEPDRFSAVVGMPGQFTGDTDRLSVLAGKPIRLMVGEFDEAWVRGTETTVGSLESLGISADVDVVPGQGHVLTLFDVDLMNWIDAAIGYEER